ncbi:hypothetical protein PO124_23455 [Bacillus licheniformis]|nr:hypothetical protein [Bacillus licheniformis]
MIYLPPSYGSGETAIPFYTSMTWEIYSIRHTATVCAQSKAVSSQEVPELLLVGVAPKTGKANTRLFPSGICCRINGSTAGRATNMPLFGQSAQASYRPALPNKSEP